MVDESSRVLLQYFCVELHHNFYASWHSQLIFCLYINQVFVNRERHVLHRKPVCLINRYKCNLHSKKSVFVSIYIRL
jgi:hypothetical protein